jgi:hypothetical protein
MRIFAIFDLFSPDFYVSKIPLNITEYSILTKAILPHGGARHSGVVFVFILQYLRALSNLTLIQDFSAKLFQHRKALFRPLKKSFRSPQER